MSDQPVATASEWAARRERVWESVRSMRRDYGIPAQCFDYGGECVAHISSQGVRRCAICDHEILADVPEGAYVDRDMARTVARAIALEQGFSCFSINGGRCELTYSADLKTGICKHCGSAWTRNDMGRYTPDEWMSAG